jgi:hypothetical protein
VEGATGHTACSEHKTYLRFSVASVTEGCFTLSGVASGAHDSGRSNVIPDMSQFYSLGLRVVGDPGHALQFADGNWRPLVCGPPL